MVRSTPAAPPAARPQRANLPMATILAPKAIPFFAEFLVVIGAPSVEPAPSEMFSLLFVFQYFLKEGGDVGHFFFRQIRSSAFFV